jgi:hypothetical protein
MDYGHEDGTLSSELKEYLGINKGVLTLGFK